MSHHDLDACALALRQIQEFLHGELAELDANQIRHHLAACEECMDLYDVEQAIALLIRRCCPEVKAPPSLRMSITTIHIQVD